jgi:hypothetical protein
MMTQPKRRKDRETAVLAVLAGYVSLVAFLIYFRHGAVLFYGDAVAHINIARRVFDSRTPGLLQLGTVWLPLQHLLMIPFLLSDWLWRTGMGGSIPSMVAYVAGVVGIFRLVRGALSFPAEPDAAARLAAWLAALIYAANPNLIYLQSTPMTEPLYLAFFIWAVVYFSEFVQQQSVAAREMAVGNSQPLIRCGLCLAGAELTRYDGWFIAAVMATAVLLMASSSRAGWRAERSRRNFLLLASAAPILWLGYNGIIYRDPLEFATGPYSARAIEKRGATPGFPSHPGARNPYVSAVYFLKAAELNVAPGIGQKLWVVLALAGSLVILLFSRRLALLLLLWLPLPFYALSIAYGGVPVYLPVWWPFSYYNLRYGLQLLPAIAVSIAVLLYFLLDMTRNRVAQAGLAFGLVALVAASYVSVWRQQPVCYREAWVNSRTRLALETELARQLEMLPAQSAILMYLGDHVGALQDAGIPLSRTINEGNHRTWKQPTDPEGLWERALADPGRYADYVVAFAGDPVARAIAGRELQSIVRVHTSGQPEAVIYRTRSE